MKEKAIRPTDSGLAKRVHIRTRNGVDTWLRLRCEIQEKTMHGSRILPTLRRSNPLPFTRKAGNARTGGGFRGERPHPHRTASEAASPARGEAKKDLPRFRASMHRPAGAPRR